MFFKVNSLFTSKPFFYLYLTTIILLVVLPLNSAAELNTITVLELRADYLAHVLLFAPWALFRHVHNPSRWLWFALGIAAAAGTEGLQYILPYRTFNINDLLANSIGVFVGYLVTWLRLYVVT
jgi:glycopeptide antibiotics resistance protein